jgi:hypothetical protein
MRATTARARTDGSRSGRSCSAETRAVLNRLARMQVGMIHARKIVTVTASERSFQISLDSETISVVPRTSTREIHRYKAYATRAGTPDG